MKTIILTILQFMSDFVYLYPLLMSFVWMVGGLIFYWRIERRAKNPPEFKDYPFFSIIIPCHNEEKQIRETISHLMELDYPEFEIIAVEDGSTDGTATILHELCQRYERLRCSSH